MVVLVGWEGSVWERGAVEVGCGRVGAIGEVVRLVVRIARKENGNGPCARGIDNGGPRRG